MHAFGFVRKGLPLCLLIILLLLSQGLQAQKKSKAQLERERVRMEKEIQLTNKLLKETKQVKKQSLNELNLLKKQINLRERLVTSLNEEITTLQRDIYRSIDMIDMMHQDLTRLQIEYGEIAWLTYKEQTPVSVMLWLFSSDSFYQAYRRLQYFREFSRYRKNQIQIIRRTQVFLTRKTQELDFKRNEKNHLMGKQQNENVKLVSIKKEKDHLVNSLQLKESEYQKTLKEKQKALEKLNSEIDKMIRESMKVNAKKSEKGEGESDVLNPLSGAFERNKGLLPWPLPSNKGLITGEFGVQRDKDGLEINNHGIYISTAQNQPVRAIFSGVVTAVKSIPGFGKVVIIGHGRYRTVYTNLKEVSVQEGDKIQGLQEIGIVKTDSQTGETELHFQIYRDKIPIDPAEWIAGKR
jgi:septal ring factor EnvC (AmiA/AmiB activator)